MRKPGLFSILVLFLGIFPVTVAAEHQINVVGSSTVYPFAKKVAEQFSKMTGHEVPQELSTGTVAGFQRFCSGTDDKSPDITNASRRMKRVEMETCIANGVADILEIKIGYDGIVLANAIRAPFFSLNLRQLFLALAETVPRNGELVRNPYKHWMEISLTLPRFPIKVLGPPSTSGTYDMFIRLALEQGCSSFPEMQALKEQSPERYRQVCRTIRSDGAYILAGENDYRMAEYLTSDPSALGIFGYSFLDRNRELVKGSSVNGDRPDAENIASGRYSLVRPLFVYVKKQRIAEVGGLREYVEEFTNEWTLGPDGYLVEEGLIPLPKEERKKNYYIARELKPLSIDEL